jgi:uncharacterized membrane protein YdjX (TVP38/TMEM64 family)
VRLTADWLTPAIRATSREVGFGDTLTFETLRANRETLLAWRDANYALAAAGYMALYVAVIALSLPGGAVMTMTGGLSLRRSSPAPR